MDPIVNTVPVLKMAKQSKSNLVIFERLVWLVLKMESQVIPHSTQLIEELCWDSRGFGDSVLYSKMMDSMTCGPSSENLVEDDRQTKMAVSFWRFISYKKWIRLGQVKLFLPLDWSKWGKNISGKLSYGPKYQLSVLTAF